MTAPHDPTRDRQLVTLARGIERKLARRRRLQKQLDDLTTEIRTEHNLLRSMTAPELDFGADAGELPHEGDEGPHRPEGGR